MTALEDRLRTAFRATATEIPASPPPLRLSRGDQPATSPRPRRSWITWAAPLAAAALVVAVIAGSLALTSGRPHPQASSGPISSNGVPQYYVALITEKQPVQDLTMAAEAEVISTATGAVIARVVPPKPYIAFTGITAAADDRTFVLSAQRQAHGKPNRVSAGSPQWGFFLMHIDPDHPGGAASLRALPARFVPANTLIENMALSPDGHSLAATLISSRGSRLSVFNLVTGTERTWSGEICGNGPKCYVFGGGLGFTAAVDVDTLSWTADGRKIAFFYEDRVRLLDTSLPGTDLPANSKLIAQLHVTSTGEQSWRGAIITPDGRTVVGVEEVNTPRPKPGVVQRLVAFSVATGRGTATFNAASVNEGYEEVLWTNASGSVLVVYGARSAGSLEILHAGTYTPIAMPAGVADAAW